jgi:hypothetical protein
VEHQRHAHGLERRARELGPVLRGRGRQARPAHVRKPATRALEHLPAFDDARDAVALEQLAGRFAPRIDKALGARLPCASSFCFDSIERVHDARLQAQQIGAHLGDLVGLGDGEGLRSRLLRAHFSARWPMSRRYCAPSKWMRCTIS